MKKNPLVETVCSTFPAFPFRDGPRRVYSPPPNLGACSTQIAHRRYVLYLRKCSSRSAPKHRQPLAGLAPLPSRFLPRRTGKRNGRDGSLLDSSRNRRIFSQFWTTQTDAPCPRWKLITAMNFLHEIKPACQRVARCRPESTRKLGTSAPSYWRRSRKTGGRDSPLTRRRQPVLKKFGLTAPA